MCTFVTARSLDHRDHLLVPVVDRVIEAVECANVTDCDVGESRALTGSFTMFIVNQQLNHS